MNLKNIVKFIFEVGMLKRRKHDGYTLAGISTSQIPSIAEHTLRAAIIGYILAKLENYPNPEEVVTMVVFHDIEETRIPDLNRVARRYIENIDKNRILKEQLDERLGKIGEEIRKLRLRVGYYNLNDKAGIIAKDADYLEQAFTSKEFLEQGYEGAKDWIDNIEKILRTKSAQELLKELKNTKSYEWWQGLKKQLHLRDEFKNHRT